MTDFVVTNLDSVIMEQLSGRITVPTSTIEIEYTQ